MLFQETVVYEIQERFGDDFVYTNKRGNRAISLSVLREFRKLTEGKVIWDHKNRFWRQRESDTR